MRTPLAAPSEASAIDMVQALAFVATAIATVFAQATGVRYSQGRKPHHRAWTIALALFALASAMLALGAANGWDAPKFRAFYLFGAVLDVPWLALGTVYLLGSAKLGRRLETAVWCFTGLAVGVMCSAPLHRSKITVDHIPDGKAVFGVWPRALAGVGSGVGATVVFVGAVWSAIRLVRASQGNDMARRLAGANALIALGTLVLGSTGTLKGLAGGKDEAFALGLAIGIALIYAGFSVTTPRPAVQPAAQGAAAPTAAAPTATPGAAPSP